jgi:hypothetical protein
VTFVELYAVYCRAYVDFDRVHGGPPPLRRALPPLVRAVAELAEADASNGTPLRSRAAFERCLAAGVDALGPLGLSA